MINQSDLLKASSRIYIRMMKCIQDDDDMTMGKGMSFPSTREFFNRTMSVIDQTKHCYIKALVKNDVEGFMVWVVVSDDVRFFVSDGDNIAMRTVRSKLAEEALTVVSR